MSTVTIYAENALDFYIHRFWTIWKNGTVVAQIVAVSEYIWTVDLEDGSYEFGVSQTGGSAYGTYSGTINDVPFSGVDGNHNVAFAVGVPPPPPPGLSGLQKALIVTSAIVSMCGIAYVITKKK